MEAWPSDLPQHLVLGNGETSPRNLVAFEPVAGAPVLYQVADYRARAISGRMHVTDAQAEAFLEWFFEDLASGSRPFTWHRPGVSETAIFQFDAQSPYMLEGHAGGYWLTLSLVYVRRIA